MYRLGEALRELRRKRGLSQERLAASAQITARTLRYWEADQQQPRAIELENVLAALEATPKERAQIYVLLPGRRSLHATFGSGGTGNNATPLLGPMPGIGDLLRAMRTRHGSTQEQLAVEMGVNRATIIRWEATRTLPSHEDMARLCCALRASPQEQAILQSGRLSLPQWPPHLTLEECWQQYETLMQIHEGNFTLLPLADLYFLALKRQLRLLLEGSEEALPLLAELESQHGWWLSMHGRTADACAVSWRVLKLARGGIAPAQFCSTALNILSSHAANGASGPENGVKLLYPWLRLLPPALHSSLLSDMAVYAGKAHRHDEAASFIRQAEQCLPDSCNRDEKEARHFRLAKARVLLSSGKPGDALAWLPPFSLGDRHIHELMIWAEVYLAAGDTSAAARYLDETQALLMLAPLPARQKKLDQLARQL